MKTRLFALTLVVLLFALPVGIRAQETDPVSIITAWIDAQNAGDVDASLALLADDTYITLVPPPMEGHDGVFRGKEEIRAWWENLSGLNGTGTVSDCQVDGETVTCLLNYTDDSLIALGLDSIDNEFVVIVQEGKIQTYTATMTEESLAALTEAMASIALPESGGSAFPITAVLTVLGGLVGISGLGLKALGWRRRKTN
jgi:ketosteroid isomerase-like protein